MFFSVFFRFMGLEDKRVLDMGVVGRVFVRDLFFKIFVFRFSGV